MKGLERGEKLPDDMYNAPELKGLKTAYLEDQKNADTEGYTKKWLDNEKYPITLTQLNDIGLECFLKAVDDIFSKPEMESILKKIA